MANRRKTHKIVLQMIKNRNRIIIGRLISGQELKKDSSSRLKGLLFLTWKKT